MQAVPLFLAAAVKPLLVVFIAASALIGLLALVSPRAFALVTAKGNRWIDTWRFFRLLDVKLFRKLDKWIDVDHYATGHSRLAGLALLVAAVTLGSILLLS